MRKLWGLSLTSDSSRTRMKSENLEGWSLKIWGFFNKIFNRKLKKIQNLISYISLIAFQTKINTSSSRVPKISTFLEVLRISGNFSNQTDRSALLFKPYLPFYLLHPCVSLSSWRRPHYERYIPFVRVYKWVTINVVEGYVILNPSDLGSRIFFNQYKFIKVTNKMKLN